ncbi:transcriptional activator domain-containing protein [Micromonospora haikouensis]|uniref:Transcriptional activator domain-containing protein n=1 Tax=Micromonospora haikouensis TaxID=686309 RepID=A0A1C4XTB6_9ACTN|nr:macro domain-containing protein [Micromonospora haikouensis]SCF11694.1 transcriptional activator domain-containing protein [Micromonospora haikouensis]
MAVRVRLFGRTTIELDGVATPLPPTTATVLIRLLLAAGEPLTVDELFRDVWAPRSGPVDRPGKIFVQKRILELRKLLDPLRPGERSEILRTERGRTSAYRLVVDPDQVDVFRFRRLVHGSHHADPATAIDTLTDALALWSGRPLFDAESFPFARRTIEQLREAREAAERALLHAYRDVGMWDRAFEFGQGLLAERPDDAALAALMDRIRREAQALPRNVVQRVFTSPRTTVRILTGDLFGQEDAHLVVGFSDTFDTSTTGDIVINSDSVQGQLLRREYGGDRAWLDRELRRALADAPKVATETRAAKRRGKLIRYPVGTVAVLRQPRRRIFGVAYSRMGNDLVAESSVAELRVSLDRVWDAAERHGQLGVLAMPLIGSGLARLPPVGREELIKIILRSYVDRSRQRLFCPELRIVLRPADVSQVDILDVAAFLRQL